MSKLKALGLGILLGTLLCVCKVCYEADQQIAAMETKLSSVSATVTSISFEQQIKEDHEKIYLEWVEEKEETAAVEEMYAAPYSCIPLSDELQIYTEQRCTDYGIDFFTFMALMESESTFNENAVGDNGKSVGLMQINAVWKDAMAEKGIDLAVPKENIEAGLIILSQYMDKYQDEATAIQMYKCGESKGREFLSAGKILQIAKNVVERGNEIRKEATHSEE